MKKITKKNFSPEQFDKDIKSVLEKYGAKSHIIFVELQDGSGPCHISGINSTLLSMAARINEQLIEKLGPIGSLALLSSLMDDKPSDPKRKSGKKKASR